MNKCLLSRPGLIAGPLHSTPLQIISQSILRLVPIDSKSSFSIILYFISCNFYQFCVQWRCWVYRLMTTHKTHRGSGRAVTTSCDAIFTLTLDRQPSVLSAAYTGRGGTSNQSRVNMSILRPMRSQRTQAGGGWSLLSVLLLSVVVWTSNWQHLFYFF